MHQKLEEIEKELQKVEEEQFALEGKSMAEKQIENEQIHKVYVPLHCDDIYKKPETGPF